MQMSCLSAKQLIKGLQRGLTTFLATLVQVQQAQQEEVPAQVADILVEF